MGLQSSAQAAVGLGGNQGDRLGLLERAAAMLRALPDCRRFRFSPVYETAAVDCREPLPFLNAAARFETGLTPRALLGALLDIERRLGRRRPYPNAPRPIDLDLLLYGDLVADSDELTLPHPRMAQRLFVLTPLAEIWPEAVHPGAGLTIRELAQRRAVLDRPEDVIAKSRFQWDVDHFR